MNLIFFSDQIQPLNNLVQLNITEPVTVDFNVTDISSKVPNIPISEPISIHIPLNIYLTGSNMLTSHPQLRNEKNPSENVIDTKEESKNEKDVASASNSESLLPYVNLVEPLSRNQSESHPQMEPATVVSPQSKHLSTESLAENELKTVSQILAGDPQFSNISMALFTAFGANTDLQVCMLFKYIEQSCSFYFFNLIFFHLLISDWKQVKNFIILG